MNERSYYGTRFWSQPRDVELRIRAEMLRKLSGVKHRF